MDRTGPNGPTSVQPSVQAFPLFGLRSGPGLNGGSNWIFFFLVDMLAWSLMTRSDRAKLMPIPQALTACPFSAKQVARSCLMAQVNRAIFLPSSLVLLPWSSPVRFGSFPVWSGLVRVLDRSGPRSTPLPEFDLKSRLVRSWS